MEVHLALLGQRGSCSSAQLPVELSENLLQNLFLNLPPHSACTFRGEHSAEKADPLPVEPHVLAEGLRDEELEAAPLKVADHPRVLVKVSGGETLCLSFCYLYTG